VPVIYVCDACGKTQDENEPFTEFGFVTKKSYCPTCTKGVEELLRKRDEGHEALAASWYWSIGIHVALWKEKHPNGSLPDEP